MREPKNARARLRPRAGPVAGLTCAAAIALAAPSVRAGGDAAPGERKTADAEALFRAGKMLLSQRDYARACPLLGASVQIEAATGALLALAICHEGEGKLASALAEYQRVVDRSQAEGRGDRATVAGERAALLGPRLSTLTIMPPQAGSDLPGLAISCNGAAVERAEWGTAIPRDGGEYLVAASAPGRKPWQARVSLVASTDHQTVAIPELEVVPAVAVVASSATAPVIHGREPDAMIANPPRLGDGTVSPSGPSALRVTGIVLMGAGAVGLVASGVYALRAMSQNADSRGGCTGDVCNQDGKRARLAAMSSGRTATIAGVAGGVSLAVGIAAFLWGGHGRAAATGAREFPVAVTIDPGAGRLLLGVGFSP